MVGDIEYKDISFIHKYRANRFLLRVYITYKPIKTLLYSILRFLRNKYKILNKIINIVYKTDEIIKNIFIKINNKTEQKRQSFQERAKQEIDKGNFKEAIKYFNKVKIKEDNYWIYGDRAIAKMRIGDYKGAIKDFDKILELEPKEIFKEKREECLKKINKK
jgi:tetratricopeptide (TPR) repeat protein